MKALIFQNKIVEVHPDGFDVHPDFSWVDCPEDCTTKWTYDGEFHPPPPPDKEQERERVLANLERRRFQIETSGVSFLGVDVHTDRESQMKLIGARILAKEAQESAKPFSMTWKGKNGWLELDAGQVIALSDLVSAHVQNAYKKEKGKEEAIKNLQTLESIQTYNIDEGW